MLDKTSVFVCVVLGATLSIAHADTEPEADPGTAPRAASTPSGEGGDQLTLPKGRLLLNAFLEASLVSGSEFKPFSITPDLWYGVNDDLTVGLVHSGLGRNGFVGAAGDALCLSGTDGGCGKVYDRVGLDARYKLKTGPLSYAIDGGVYAQSLDPVAIAVKVGFSGRWHKDKLAVEFQPNVFIGVTERDGAGGTETLYIPITGLYSITPQIALALQTGGVVPFDNTGDTFRIPLSIGAHYTLNESLNLFLAFSFPAIVAGTNGGTDLRSITLGATYAF